MLLFDLPGFVGRVFFIVPLALACRQDGSRSVCPDQSDSFALKTHDTSSHFNEKKKIPYF